MALPTYMAERRVEGGRLAYYMRSADTGFWDQHWQGQLGAEYFAMAQRGQLGEYEKIFIDYLPQQGRILEAGCGLGQFVMALNVRGYEVEGVEWGGETVTAALQHCADLPIREGDVTRLDVPDGYYEGYISLGVVEHRYEGPEPFLAEANRVLAPGGIAVIAVPHFHRLRKLKARLGGYHGDVMDREFYQYAFSFGEFADLLQVAGFSILSSSAVNSFKGIKDELALFRLFATSRIGMALLTRIMPRLIHLERMFGHMLVVVCRKG
jgi:SAM-dependent methyltransferase